MFRFSALFLVSLLTSSSQLSVEAFSRSGNLFFNPAHDGGLFVRTQSGTESYFFERAGLTQHSFPLISVTIESDFDFVNANDAQFHTCDIKVRDHYFSFAPIQGGGGLFGFQSNSNGIFIGTVPSQDTNFKCKYNSDKDSWSFTYSDRPIFKTGDVLQSEVTKFDKGPAVNEFYIQSSAGGSFNSVSRNDDKPEEEVSEVQETHKSPAHARKRLNRARKLKSKIEKLLNRLELDLFELEESPHLARRGAQIFLETLEESRIDDEPHQPKPEARVDEAASAAVDLPALDAPTGTPSHSLSSIEFVSNRAEFFVRITIGQWPGRLAKPNGFVFLFTDENNAVIRHEVAFNFAQSKTVYDIKDLQGLTYTVTAQAKYPEGLSQPTRWPTLDLHHDVIQF